MRSSGATMILGALLAVAACDTVPASSGGASVGGESFSSAGGGVPTSGPSSGGAVAISLPCPSACVPRLFLQVAFPASLGDASTGTLSVCKNDDCYTADLSKFASATQTLAGPCCAEVTVTLVHANGSATLMVQWQQATADASSFVDGDRFRITVALAGSASQITLFDRPVSYVPQTPGCPFMCLGANIDATQDAEGGASDGGAAGESASGSAGEAAAGANQ